MSERSVFFINSNIVERISRAIVEEESIEDPLFLVATRYESELEDGVSIRGIYELECSPPTPWTANWLPILRGDRILSKLTGGSFHLFTPYTHFDEIRLLLSHRQCTGHSMMEEGLMSYLTREELDTMVTPRAAPLRRKIAYFGRLGTYTFCRQGYRRAYAITEGAFPGFPNRRLVSIDFGRKSSADGISSEDCILILESLTHYDKETASCYVVALITVLNRIRERYPSVHFKLHPDNYGTWQEDLLRGIIDRWGPPAEEIDRSASIEDVAVASEADVIVDLSSVGLYCGVFSAGRAYSFHHLLSSPERDGGGRVEPGERSDISDYVPGVFWDYVEPLDDPEAS